MDIIFNGGKIENKEKVREYKFTTDLEHQNLPLGENDPTMPVEKTLPAAQADDNKAADKENPKKPGPDDNSGSDGGPGGERLLPVITVPPELAELQNGDQRNPQ